MNSWKHVQGPDDCGSHYSVFRQRLSVPGMDALREIFPKAKADEMNFVLFSTSGVHGTYQTIEEEEAEPGTGITFLVVHPRMVTLRYGIAHPKTPDDFHFLRCLRHSSMQAVQTIGMPPNEKKESQ